MMHAFDYVILADRHIFKSKKHIKMLRAVSAIIKQISIAEKEMSKKPQMRGWQKIRTPHSKRHKELHHLFSLSKRLTDDNHSGENPGLKGSLI